MAPVEHGSPAGVDLVRVRSTRGAHRSTNVPMHSFATESFRIAYAKRHVVGVTDSTVRLGGDTTLLLRHRSGEGSHFHTNSPVANTRLFTERTESPRECPAANQRCRIDTVTLSSSPAWRLGIGHCLAFRDRSIALSSAVARCEWWANPCTCQLAKVVPPVGGR